MLRILFSVALIVLSLSRAEAFAAEPPLSKTSVDHYGDPLISGATARLGTVRFRAGFGLLAFAFTADGKQIVTATREGPIRFWDVATGRAVREIEKGPARSTSFAISADGKWAASIDEYFNDAALEVQHSLRYWNLEAGKIAWEVSQEERFGERLCISANGSHVAFVDGGKLQVWDGAAGVVLVERDSPPSSMHMVFSPDARWLAFPDNNQLHLWNWSEDKAPRSQAIPHKNSSLYQAAFSADSKMVAATSLGIGGIYLFDVAGEAKPRAPLTAEQKIGASHVAFAPDGRCLAVARDGRKKQFVWDVTAGKELVELEPGGILNWRGAVFSADASLVAMGDEHGMFGVWNTKTGRLAGKERASHDQPVWVITVAPGGKQVVTGTLRGTVRAWDTATGKLSWQYEHNEISRAGRFAQVTCVAVSPDGQWIASTSDEFTRVVYASDGREKFRLAGHKNPGIAVFSTDGKRLATCNGYDKPLLRLWDLQTGKALAEHAIAPSGIHVDKEDPDDWGRADAPFDGGPGPLHFDAYAFSGDLRKLGVALRAKTYLFDVKSGREVLKFDTEPRSPSKMSLTPDGGRMAVAYYPQVPAVKLPSGQTYQPKPKHTLVRCYDTESGKMLRELQVPGAGSGGVVYSPDGTLLAGHSNGPGSAILVWRAESGEELARFACGDAYPVSLAISHDNKTMYSGMSDTSVLVWDLPK